MGLQEQVHKEHVDRLLHPQAWLVACRCSTIGARTQCHLIEAALEVARKTHAAALMQEEAREGGSGHLRAQLALRHKGHCWSSRQSCLLESGGRRSC